MSLGPHPGTPPPELHLRTAPFLSRDTTTPKIMRDVLWASLPLVAAGTWFFGIGALLLVVTCTLGATLTEWLFTSQVPRGASLRDFTAPLTGVLLGLTLPPALPLWMAFIGGAFGIGLGKLVWGGLGQNLFNPALVGRAFLQAAFPSALTTWTPPGDGTSMWRVASATLSPPFLGGGVDAITTATPLARMKFEQATTPLGDLLAGSVGGSIGETSAVLVIVGGLYLLMRRAFDWRIPVGILVVVAAASGVLHLARPLAYPTPAFMLLSGGLLFGAVFMATDPVTSPMSPRGKWIFASGIGILVVLIRVFGGLPEGVMYAILLMNAATPLIERFVHPRAFGRGART